MPLAKGRRRGNYSSKGWVAPSASRLREVSRSERRQREGGGDAQAIAAFIAENGVQQMPTGHASLIQKKDFHILRPEIAMTFQDRVPGD